MVQELLVLLDQAFEGDAWHSLIANLGADRAEDWGWAPPGSRRSIRHIVAHVGECKLMYENHAFGDATRRWEDFDREGARPVETVPSAIAWLRAGQACLRGSIAQLDDAELERPRRTNWGELKPTRWIIQVMIAHDLYHAGEINHLRALRQGNDRWAYDKT
jgi:hypothetical protein